MTMAFRYSGPLLMVVSILLCVILLEAALRLVQPFHYDQIPSEPFGELFSGYPMKKDYSFTFVGNLVLLPPSKIRINSIGLRDHDYPVQKPRGTQRILCLGDSLTFGQGVDLEDTFAKILERRYAGEHLKVEVLNFGVPGYGTLDELRLMEEVGFSYQPDIVLLTMLGSDYKNVYGWNATLAAKAQSELNKGSAAYTLRWLRDLVEIYDAQSSEKVNGSAKANKILVPLESLVEATRENDAILVVGDLLCGEEYDQVRSFLESQHVPTIALCKVWYGLPPESLFLKVEDGKIMDGHLSRRGAEIVAEALYNVTRPLLQQ